MPLPIERVDDVAEAHEITDQRQILTLARVIGACECAGHDVAKLGDVAHVNAAHIWSKRESPAHGSVGLLLLSKYAHEVLVEEWCDDERMICKPRFRDHAIDLRLARSPVTPNSTKQQLSGRFDFRIASVFILTFTDGLLDALEAASKVPAPSTTTRSWW